MQNDHKVGFIIDIDGTLVLGKKPLPGARDTLELLRKSNIPFLLLTNNVAKSE
jgi:4-nitrophenyl phosphatase